MSPAAKKATGPSVQRGPRAPILTPVAAVALCVLTAGAVGCSSGASQPLAQTPTQTLGARSASAFVTKKYGITEWRASQGSNWIVVTGYRADGRAARGVAMAWFPSTATAPGHARVKMLDGSGAVFRRTVNGGQSGHLSDSQFAFVQAMRGDLLLSGASSGGESGSSSRSTLVQASGSDRMGPAASVEGGLGVASQPLGDSTPSLPGEGPRCREAQEMTWTKFGHRLKCVLFLGCGERMQDSADAVAACYNEDREACKDYPQLPCDFKPIDPKTSDAETPECDDNEKECVCAEVGTYYGEPCGKACGDGAQASALRTTLAAADGNEVGACGLEDFQDSTLPEEALSQTGSDDPCDGQTAWINLSAGGTRCSDDPLSGEEDASTDEPPSAIEASAAACSWWDCVENEDCCMGTCKSGTCDDNNASSGGGGSGGDLCVPDGESCLIPDECCTKICDKTLWTCGTPA